MEAAGGVYLGTIGPDGPYGTRGEADFLAASEGLDQPGSVNSFVTFRSA